MADSNLESLARRLRDFAAERDWEKFHTPKNLAMALTAEAGELAAELQWLTAEESRNPEPERHARICSEAADVLTYLLLLADKLGIDLLAVTQAKVEQNELRYPADRVRGSAKKYTDY